MATNISPSSADAGAAAVLRPLAAQPATLGEMVLDVCGRHTGVALQYPRGRATVYISYPELGTIATEIARGLLSLGIQAGDPVAILGQTSAEWTLADCGALCAAAVVTPIYHTNSPQECAYVLAHSEARLVFCADPAQAAKVAQVRAQCPALKHVVLFDGTAPGAITLDELRRAGTNAPADAVWERVAAVSPGDVATLVYTSGTTGPPKGCMLSHRNFLFTTRMYVERLGFNETHSVYQFLPLAHVLARVAQAVALSVGARVIYWSGDPVKIVDELAATAPTHVPAVPRIYEKVHGAVVGRVSESSPVRRALFNWALRRGRRARAAVREQGRAGPITHIQYRIADRLVLRQVRALFGPRLQLAMVGAAPIAPDLIEFFDACGVLVLEGYGLSESCAAATMNGAGAFRPGTVGRPLLGTEVELGEDGELLIRGPHVFLGYHKDRDATGEVLTSDGWLHTGDLGTMTADGFVAITGRTKELIITSSGKNITPVNIERELRQSRYITEAVVFGDNRPYLVALVTLDRDEVKKLAPRLGIDPDAPSMAGDPRVRAEIQRAVDAVNAKFARIEQIKRFAVLDHDLSQSRGELTPTLKVKRAVVYEKYAHVFAALYAQAGAS